MKIIFHRASRVVGTTVLGVVLLVAGAVMLVTPGPGLLAVAGGLAVLAREYRWARRLLDDVRARIAPHAARALPRRDSGVSAEREDVEAA